MENCPVSTIAFLVSVNEAFGYTHEQTLDSSYTLILSMMSEYAYMMNERYGDDKKEGDDDKFEWVEVPDFVTGENKRYKKYKDVVGKIKT